MGTGIDVRIDPERYRSLLVHLTRAAADKRLQFRLRFNVEAVDPRVQGETAISVSVLPTPENMILIRR